MSKMDQGPQGPPPPAGFAPPPPYSAVAPPNQGYAPPPTHQGYTASPPPSGFNAPPPQAQQTVIVVQNTCFGPDPQAMRCPYCQADMVTNVESRPTAMTHVAFLLCFIFICWPCAPFVYCTDSCLAKKHYCSNCYRFLGQNEC